MRALESGQFLYHYTTRSAAFDHVLPTGRIRFSPYKSMRDPLENKLPIMVGGWFVPEDVPPDDPEHPEAAWWALNQGIQRIWENSKLLSLTADDESQLEADSPLRKGWQRARMWEQYAENHAGACLFFNREKLTACIERAFASSDPGSLFRGLVHYSAEPVDRSAGVDFGSLAGKVDNQYVNQFVNERKEDLFFRKTNDWATEFEYRFVSTVPGGSYVYVDFEDALEFVMVSERFPHWQRPGAIEASQAVGTKPLVVDWSTGRPRMANLKTHSRRFDRRSTSETESPTLDP
mgnify:CR=1 FL=1